MRDHSSGVDVPIIRRAMAVGSSQTAASKAFQLATVSAVTTGAPLLTDHFTTDVYSGSWCVIAPPMAPDLDAQGQPSGAACDALVADFGDFGFTLGTRDVRLAKYAADLAPGEAALINAFGARVFLRERFCGLAAFGGSLLFDKDGVGATGVPAKPGGSAAWWKLNATQFAASSGSGGAQVTLDGSNAVIRAAAVTLQALQVKLGDGASDPLVLLSHLTAVVSTLVTWANTHVHPVTAVGSPTGPSVPPLLLTPSGSKSVMGIP